MRTSMKRAVVAGTALVLVAGAGAAYAAWKANGSGNASAKAESARVLTTLDVTATTDANLYPGATADAKIRIDNPNKFPVKITSVLGAGAITADSGHTGCTVTGVTFANQAGLALTVGAGSAATFDLSNAVSMSNDSEDGCQGATFSIPVTFTGVSNA